MRRLIVVAYGGTVEAIDAVRVLTNKSRGALGREIVREALARGFAVHALVGEFALAPAEAHPQLTLERFGSARDLGRRLKRALASDAGALVMAAAVSDYRPARAARGKLSSAPAERTLRLVKNPKLIDLCRRAHPRLPLVSFKLLERGASRAELLSAAEAQRLRTASTLVVANRWPSRRRHDAYLVDGGTPRLVSGRAAIARAVIRALH